MVDLRIAQQPDWRLSGSVAALEVAQDSGDARGVLRLRSSQAERGSADSAEGVLLLDDPVSQAMRSIEDEAWPEAKESSARSLADHPEDVRCTTCSPISTHVEVSPPRHWLV